MLILQFGTPEFDGPVERGRQKQVRKINLGEEEKKREGGRRGRGRMWEREEGRRGRGRGRKGRREELERR